MALYKENAEENFESFRRGYTSAETDYVDDCWIIFKMAVKFGTLYTIDLEEELPELPFNVSIRQGYMIRQGLFDLALQLKEEMEDES